MTERNINIAERQIIFCKCRGERISPETLDIVETRLQYTNAEVFILDDLCGIAIKNTDALTGLFHNSKEVMIIGCYYRTMNIIFNQIKKYTEEIPAGWHHLNLAELTSDEAVKRIMEFNGDKGGKPVISKISYEGDWPSWYPVIDYKRCTDCGQCADFCLFGVFERDGAVVKVANPESCKNNCPACARICPSTAIIFPKYKHGGAIGGSDEIDEISEQGRQTRDISDILGGDIVTALENRKLRRKSIILKEAMRKAQEEKENALRESNS